MSVGERILKIGQRLAKLAAEIQWHLFFWTLVYSYCDRYVCRQQNKRVLSLLRNKHCMHVTGYTLHTLKVDNTYTPYSLLHAISDVTSK